jgi:hypothetical protein
MAQFTVYKNKNPRSKTTYPLLVDAQADLLDELQTRLGAAVGSIAGQRSAIISALGLLITDA